MCCSAVAKQVPAPIPATRSIPTTAGASLLPLVTFLTTATSSRFCSALTMTAVAPAATLVLTALLTLLSSVVLGPIVTTMTAITPAAVQV